MARRQKLIALGTETCWDLVKKFGHDRAAWASRADPLGECIDRMLVEAAHDLDMGMRLDLLLGLPSNEEQVVIDTTRLANATEESALAAERAAKAAEVSARIAEESVADARRAEWTAVWGFMAAAISAVAAVIALFMGSK